MSDKISICLETFQWAELDPHLPPDVCPKIIGLAGDMMMPEVRFLSDETEYSKLLHTAWKYCPHLVKEIEKQKQISSSR
jgi:hypothetical protein